MSEKEKGKKLTMPEKEKETEKTEPSSLQVALTKAIEQWAKFKALYSIAPFEMP